MKEKKAKKIAEDGIEELKNHVDTLIVIPNESIYTSQSLFLPNPTEKKAFHRTDNVLYQTMKEFTQSIVKPGVRNFINLSFEDISSNMKDKGYAMFGFANNLKSLSVVFKDQAINSQAQNIEAHDAANHPLSVEEMVKTAMTPSFLDKNLDISTAESVILNITGGNKLTLDDIHMITQKVRETINDVHIIIQKVPGKNKDISILAGANINPQMEDDEINLSILVTGLKYN